MKKILLIAVFLLGLCVYIFYFQKPERYLKKATQKALKAVDVKPGVKKTLLSTNSRVSSVVKHIHYDVLFKVDYKGRLEQAQSLNEFRSWLFFYLQKANPGRILYEEINVQMIDEEKAQVFFKFSTSRESEEVSCDASLDWLKEDKWFIKKIDIKNCS